MAPESNNNNWLSFSLSSMEMLNNANSSSSSSSSSVAAAASSSVVVPTSADSHHYYSFADNFYATGWPNQKANMYSETSDNQAMYAGYMQPSPKLEDFFAGGDSTETQDDSSLTHIYDHHQAGNYYDQQDLKGMNGFQSFSANSGSEVDDSGFGGGQTQSPGESGSELVAYSHCHQINNTAAAASTNGLSLGVNVNNNNNNNNINVNTNSTNHTGNTINDALIVSSSSNNNYSSNDKTTAIVAVESEKKISDTFGQRTSIYRGVTRHRWTGRYEAHLWDNSCRREGKARKGRQVYLGGYDKEDKAARAYDLAALKYWGPTATTNFPISTYSKEVEEMKHVTKQEFIASLRRKSSGFSRGASIYRGVTRHHQQGRWQARIGRVAGNKDLYLGTFATEEEAAEAYDIAAIKFRGINAVTNFEMNRYDVEAISKSPLPIGGAAKRLKISLEGEDKQQHLLGSSVQTPCSNISFSAIQPTNIPCGIPFDNAAPYYHHNLFHHYNQQNGTESSNSVTPMALLPPPSEFFIWPQQNY